MPRREVEGRAGPSSFSLTAPSVNGRGRVDLSEPWAPDTDTQSDFCAGEFKGEKLVSSLTRRLQIRGLKARGFARTPFRLAKEPDGTMTPQRVKRGGLILDPANEPIGYRWPRIARPALG